MATSNTYSLYRHISPSGRVYVGITSLRPEKRWGKDGALYCGHPDYPFARAIKKYGWDAFKHEVLLSSLSEEAAKLLEIMLIAYYKAMNMSYNITNGGESGSGNRSHSGLRASEETRKKMSVSKGQVVYQYTRDGALVRRWESQKAAADTLGIYKGAISSACCGRIRSYKGFFWSVLPPDKWCLPKDKHFLTGRKRKVYQYSLDGALISVWNSVTEASNGTGISVPAISSACNYKNKSRGYLWSYNKLRKIELKKIEAQKQIAKSRGTSSSSTKK